MNNRSIPALRTQLESLEAREVPAVVLAGTFDVAAGATTPTGGNITVSELAAQTTTSLPTTGATPVQTVTFTGTENDNLTLALNGSALTITNDDGSGNGIYVRDQTGLLRRVGNSITVQGATSLNVVLDQGGDDGVFLSGGGALPTTINAGPGNDTITDISGFTATLNGGTGNDIIRATGANLNPLLLQFLLQPGGLPPALIPALVNSAGVKTLQGGAGDDYLSGPFLGLFDILDGGDGNDVLVGGLGIDVLFGGPGSDVMVGSGGNDFYLANDSTPDFVFNLRGDTVISDAVDTLATPLFVPRTNNRR